MAVSGGVSPVYKGGGPRITASAASALTEGTLVELAATGASVQTAGAASLKVLGVALQTAGAASDLIAVDTSGVHLLTASGAISAGDKVETDTGGKVKTIAAVNNASAATVATGVTDTRAQVGIALDDIADTAKGRILLTVGA